MNFFFEIFHLTENIFFKNSWNWLIWVYEYYLFLKQNFFNFLFRCGTHYTVVAWRSFNEILLLFYSIRASGCLLLL